MSSDKKVEIPADADGVIHEGKIVLRPEVAEAIAESQAASRAVGRLPKYEVPEADPLDLKGLNEALDEAGRYALMKVEGGRDRYYQHGMGEILARPGDGGSVVPALYTYWINGSWHITSAIVKWERAPDHVSRWNKPQWMVDAHPDEPTFEDHSSRVIRITTESGSTYELRY